MSTSEVKRLTKLIQKAKKDRADAMRPDWPIKPSEIRSLRVRLGLSQFELAREVGVRLNTVWRWESGRMAPGAEYVSRLLGLMESKVSP